MGQFCTAMAPLCKDKNQKIAVLEGIRPEKCFSGHVTRSTAVQCQYMISTLMKLVEEKPTLKILDVGCGAGAIAVDFALQASEGKVVGLDLSGAVLETAKVHAQHEGVGNVTFVRGDVHRLPFADGSFDVVHTHQSLAHFIDHKLAIKEMVRVTKKGGVLCMREGDLQTAKFCSDSMLLQECFKLIMAVHKSNGGKTDAGAKLVAWTIDAGVPARNITATQRNCIYDTPEERRDYGGHWPARCTYGIFADLAMEMGTSR